MGKTILTAIIVAVLDCAIAAVKELGEWDEITTDGRWWKCFIKNKHIKLKIYYENLNINKNITKICDNPEKLELVDICVWKWYNIYVLKRR